MKYIVYKITNTINNKLYFGITQQSLKIRWQQHKCNSNKKSYHLYNAIKKYGFENFKIEVVFYAESKNEMYGKEKQLICEFKTNDRLFGYNNSIGGESSRAGCKLTQEHKNKISEYQKKRIRKPLSEETKLKIGIANKNNTISDAHKKAISYAHKGKPALNKKKVILNNNIIFESLTDGSNQTGVSITSISNNLNGLSKKTKKGKWEIYEQKNSE